MGPVFRGLTHVELLVASTIDTGYIEYVWFGLVRMKCELKKSKKILIFVM